ncbi:hypothetical protein ACFE04_019772 [Oxalis oulophora]
MLSAFANKNLSSDKKPYGQNDVAPSDGPPLYCYSIIQMIKGDFHIIEIQWSDGVVTEIVSPERLRHPNNNPPIDRNTFFKFELEVPRRIKRACETGQRAQRITENY